MRIKMNVHPGHLNFLMKTHNGLNAKKAIDNRILLEAKYLLTNSSGIYQRDRGPIGFFGCELFLLFFGRWLRCRRVVYREEVVQRQFGRIDAK